MIPGTAIPGVRRRCTQLVFTDHVHTAPARSAGRQWVLFVLNKKGPPTEHAVNMPIRPGFQSPESSPDRRLCPDARDTAPSTPKRPLTSGSGWKALPPRFPRCLNSQAAAQAQASPAEWTIQYLQPRGGGV